jgi:cytochrome b
VPVWDRAIRLFHWSQLVLMAAALTTGFLLARPWFQLHVAIGYALALLLAFRLVWGVFGSEYSRFSRFEVQPRRVIAHVLAVARRHSPHHLGHNPAGAAMAMLLLSVVAALVGSGLVLLGGEHKQGPLGSLIGFATGDAAHRLHELLAWGVMGLVAVHVTGVVVESRLSGENLVRAMIHGRKRLPAGAPVPALRPSRPRLALASLAGLGLTAAVFLVVATRQPPAGVPDVPPLPAHSAECGACHWAYHPSLLPAASWQRIMAGLDDHFGEDARLAPAKAAAIGGWLTGHAAESWDTLPAQRLRTVNPLQPLRITATPFWKKRHGHLEPAVFRSVKGGSGNCAGCHGDADRGTFNFRTINLPSPATLSSPASTP